MEKKMFFIQVRIVFNGTIKDGVDDNVVDWDSPMHGKVELVTDSE